MANTVRVSSRASVVLHLHLAPKQPFDPWVKDPNFSPIRLNAGQTAGVDKAAFDAWRAQNRSLADQLGIMAEDEPEADAQGAIAGPETATGAPGGSGRDSVPSDDIDTLDGHAARNREFREQAAAYLAGGRPQEP